MQEGVEGLLLRAKTCKPGNDPNLAEKFRDAGRECSSHSTGGRRCSALRKCPVDLREHAPRMCADLAIGRVVGALDTDDAAQILVIVPLDVAHQRVLRLARTGDQPLLRPGEGLDHLMQKPVIGVRVLA